MNTKIKTANQFRQWLIKNHNKANECWLCLKRGRPKNDHEFYYLDAVEQALCFGWIDSVCKKVNGICYQRFSPRKKNSTWTELNKERAKRLIKLKLMTNAGLKAMRQNIHYKMDKEIVLALKKAHVWNKFKHFPNLYQRIRINNLMFYKKKNLVQYKKSLKHLISTTKENKMFGEWNDYGRLLNY